MLVGRGLWQGLCLGLDLGLERGLDFDRRGAEGEVENEGFFRSLPEGERDDSEMVAIMMIIMVYVQF